MARPHRPQPLLRHVQIKRYHGKGTPRSRIVRCVLPHPATSAPDLQELGIQSIGHRRLIAKEIEALRAPAVPTDVAVAFGVASPPPKSPPVSSPLLQSQPAWQIASSAILDAPADSELNKEAASLVTSVRADTTNVLLRPENVLRAASRLAASPASAIRRASAEVVSQLCMAIPDTSTARDALINMGAVDCLGDLIRHATPSDDDEHSTRTVELVARSLLGLVERATAAHIANQLGIPPALWLARARPLEGAKLIGHFSLSFNELEEPHKTHMLSTRCLRTLAGYARSPASQIELRHVATAALDTLVTDDTFEAIGSSNMRIEITNTALALTGMAGGDPVLLGLTAHLLATVWNGATDEEVRKACLDALVLVVNETATQPDAREPAAAALCRVMAADPNAMRRIMLEEGLLLVLGARLRAGTAQEMRDAVTALAELTDDPEMQHAVVHSHMVVPLSRLAIRPGDEATRAEALRTLGNLMPVYSDRIALLGGLGAVLDMCKSEKEMPPRVVAESARVLARITASAESLLSLQWHQPSVRGPPPPARCGHTGVVWRDMLVVFGGEERAAEPASPARTTGAGRPARLFADLHVLDLPTMTWRHVESVLPADEQEKEPAAVVPIVQGDIGCGGVADDDAQPPPEPAQPKPPSPKEALRPTPRTRHTATLVGNQMFVFGGFGLGPEGLWCLLNELLVLDLETWTWHRPKAHGNAPSPRSGHAASRLGSKEILVFGGWGSPHLKYNDMHVLNVETMTWAEPHFNGRRPDPSEGASLITLRPSHCALAFGGAMSDSSHSGLALYDVRTLQVQRIEQAPGWPSPRAGHAFHRVGINHLLAFGGWDSTTDSKTDSLAVLDTTLLRWEHPDIEGQAPSPRSLFASGAWRGGMVLFGGSDARARGLSDVHVLRIERALKHEVGRAMTGGESPSVVDAVISLARYHHKPSFRYLKMAVENIGSTDASMGLSVERAAREASVDGDILPSASTHRVDPLTHLYVPAVVNTTLVVPSGGHHDVQMEVKPGVTRSIIVWSIHVDSYDVEVVVLRRTGEEAVSDIVEFDVGLGSFSRAVPPPLHAAAGLDSRTAGADRAWCLSVED